MTKYICDRCGSDFSAREKITLLEVQEEITLLKVQSEDVIYIHEELCSSCLRQLQEWLKPLPKCVPANVK